MARLYLLRLGSGDERVANSFNVELKNVKKYYRDALVEVHEGGIPVINGDVPANPVSNPQVVVIKLFVGEEPFGRFESPGFNILQDIDTSDAINNLVNTNNT